MATVQSWEGCGNSFCAVPLNVNSYSLLGVHSAIALQHNLQANKFMSRKGLQKALALAWVAGLQGYSCSCI
jgi:hypothetical protein